MSSYAKPSFHTSIIKGSRKERDTDILKPTESTKERSGARVRQTDRDEDRERERQRNRGRESGIRGEAENDTVPLTSSCCL